MSFPKFENFRVIRKICKKFCFTVYEIEDRGEEKRNFLKVLDRKTAQDPVNVYNFLNSGRMSSMLDCNNIVKVHFYGRELNHFVVVSEPIDDRTLSLYIHESSPIPLEKVLDIMIQLAEILRHAHLRGIVHGILNPNSIYINEARTIKIDDFGYSWIARNLLELEETEAMYLTYHIAPEINLRVQKIDGRADIYSLGVILLQLLTGCIPFNPFDNASTKNQRLRISLRTLRKAIPNYPKRLDKVMLKTLNKDPDLRFQNLRHFEKELRLLKDEYLTAFSIPDITSLALES
ncbi:MAG: serine/threonine protein kinase [bacterium]